MLRYRLLGLQVLAILLVVLSAGPVLAGAPTDDTEDSPRAATIVSGVDDCCQHAALPDARADDFPDPEDCCPGECDHCPDACCHSGGVVLLVIASGVPDPLPATIADVAAVPARGASVSVRLDRPPQV